MSTDKFGTFNKVLEFFYLTVVKDTTIGTHCTNIMNPSVGDSHFCIYEYKILQSPV